MKRVTDPLNDKVKARITGLDSSSSGSEHSGGAVSSTASEFFFDFGGESSPGRDDSGSECDSANSDSCFPNVDLIYPILFDRTDEFKNVLRDQVLKAVKLFACVKSDKQVIRRNVMVFLRDCGYNAAVCKTRWEKSGGITAGSYEFIDVLRKDSSSTRYFVDLDFASEFEIARPTNSYARLLQQLPEVFVGTGNDLKQILRTASDAAKASLKSRGLHLPPWRKHRFTQNKWFGSYRRTTNLFPVSKAMTVAYESHAVKCCAVGFDNGGRLPPLPSTGRTR